MSKPKKPHLISYSRISAEKQIGISKIQNLLRADGYLDGKEPTEKAYTDGIVREMRTLSDGSGHKMVMFDYDTISDYLEKHGFSGCHETRIGNRHAMLDRLTEAGQIISSLLEKRRLKDYDRISRIVGEWMYECPCELLHGSMKDVRPALKEYLAALRRDREGIYSCFRRVRFNDGDRNQYDLSLKKIDACIAWLEKA